MSENKITKKLFKILFYNQGKIYEIFAKNVQQSNLFGFIEIEDLVFGEKSQVLVDPNEDSLKKEFENTKRLYIPVHSILRIEEIDKELDLKPRIINIKDMTPRTPTIYTPPDPFRF
ncbi:MAG: DUF1820 family protein [Leptospiraceae bacterium]|nr:DUF1820 family protein [Leptospiraceae bacterium]MDW7977018.1 DUF1820 family protein [Leptospiraceae bacterium]